ncbi:MAG TPA: hypothetical protein VN706_11585 [Gemmatimonadaceae bacterium]|nr:hypothetical protein [Gemmatimonadaceae bacterium]
MNHHDQYDDDLLAHFQATRRADGERAPDFADMWREAEDRAQRTQRMQRAQRTHRTRRARWIALAAGVGIAASALAIVHVRRARTAEFEIKPEVLNWQAPTDVFLQMARSNIPATPTILESALDDAAIISGRGASSK